MSQLWAIGLMSGTSMDGIDAALLRTDGATVAEHGARLSRGYEPAFRRRLRALIGGDEGDEGDAGDVVALEADLTRLHAAAVEALLADADMAAGAVDLIGFHGQTVEHRPRQGITRQLGDGALLARLTGIGVVNDFRGADVAAGGEGAPLAPLYHLALARGLERPLAVLNLGGVANLTYIDGDNAPIAFDTGPGNALLDDWLMQHTGAPFDRDGALAARGTVDRQVLARMLARPWFEQAPPKSLDRGDFGLDPVRGLGPADGAATLAAFTAACVACACEHLPARPRHWLVCGGGRHNPGLMANLAAALDVPVRPVEAVGWDGDFLEAEAFAYLAVRSRRELPLSLPSTTGVPSPLSGGCWHPPA